MCGKCEAKKGSKRKIQQMMREKNYHRQASSCTLCVHGINIKNLHNNIPNG